MKFCRGLGNYGLIAVSDDDFISHLVLCNCVC